MTETMAPAPPASTSTAVPMLEARNIFKSFGSVQALTDVDFEVRAGEVMALVGDNGAGKSTLIKCLAGIYSIDEGDVFFEGKKVSISAPKDAAKLGIEVVYQDLALCDNLDVVQNMYLGREERDIIWRLKESIMEAKTAQTLKSLSVTTIRSIRQPVASLSGGQRQSVADRPRGDVELAPRHPRRADRCTRRRSDPAGPRSRQATRRAGARGHPHLAQPPRHLRGGGPHHRAAPRAQRGIARSQRGDAGGGRARHHGGRPDEGRRESARRRTRRTA